MYVRQSNIPARAAALKRKRERLDELRNLHARQLLADKIRAMLFGQPASVLSS